MAANAPAASPRRPHLDWMRGVAVLLMIGAHLLDSWTREADRGTAVFRNAVLVGGMGSTLFLFLAGVAVSLSAGSKWRRSGRVDAAAGAVARRGLEIFALAFLFRLQAWVLGWSHQPRDLLKVDMLNIMGPSIVAAALLWRVARHPSTRVAVFAIATVAIAVVTPLVRALDLTWLPDPVEAYFVPVPGLTTFAFFPWMGLLFAGACIGVLVDASRTPASERRVNWLLAAGGAAVALGAYAASHWPSILPRSDFWTTSPSYFFIRAGIVTVGVAAAYAWTTLAPAGWSPVVQLGRTSLFIYWIHVELVYGLISMPLHRALSIGQSMAAYVLFTAAMLACSIAKDRLVARFRRGGPQPAARQSPVTGQTRRWTDAG